MTTSNDVSRQPLQRPWLLAIPAVILLVSSAFFTLITPQLPSRMGRPSAQLVDDIGFWREVDRLPLPFLHDRQAVATLIVLVTALSFASYALAIFLCRRYSPGRAVYRIVLATTIVLFALSLLSLPTINSDIYMYLMQGRLVTEYGQNPHYVVPDRFPFDPMYAFTTAQYSRNVSDYLPVWTWVSVFSTWLAADNVVTELLMLRLLLVVVNIANLTLIAAIMRRLNPRYELAAMMIYGWNPLVMIYGASKPDTVMVFFALLGIWALLSQRSRLTPVFLTLSVLVKMISAPLMIIYVLQYARWRQWRALASAVFIAGITALLVYAPLVEGPQIFVHHLSQLNRAGSTLPPALRLLILALFVALILWIGLTRDGSVRSWVNGSAWALFYFGIFMARPSLGWYLITLIALVAVSGNRWLVWFTTALTSAAFLLTIWENISNDVFKLPELPGQRFFVYIGIVIGGAVVIASMRGVRRMIATSSRQLLLKRGL